MYRYLPIKEKVVSEDLGTYTTYGIRVVYETESQSTEFGCMSDVFTDFDRSMRFAQLCTKEQLDPIHLLDVIENFL